MLYVVRYIPNRADLPANRCAPRVSRRSMRASHSSLAETAGRQRFNSLGSVVRLGSNCLLMLSSLQVTSMRTLTNRRGAI